MATVAGRDGDSGGVSGDGHPSRDGILVAGGDMVSTVSATGGSGPPYRYLSLLERWQISTLRGQGLGVRWSSHGSTGHPRPVRQELRRSPRLHNHYDANLS